MALAPCGLDQPGISPPPQLSQDGTPPPLSPGEDRESQSKAVLPAGVTVILHVPSDLQTWWKATSLLSFSAEKWRFSLSRLSTFPSCTTLPFWPREGSHGGPTPPYLEHRFDQSKVTHRKTTWLTYERHTPRKSSDDSVSKSHTCRLKMAGSFCSVLSKEKMFSLLLTTMTWDVELDKSELFYTILFQ